MSLFNIFIKGEVYKPIGIRILCNTILKINEKHSNPSMEMILWRFKNEYI